CGISPRKPCRVDQIDAPPDQIGGQCRQPFELSGRMAEFERDVLAFHKPNFLQRLCEGCREKSQPRRLGCPHVKDPNHPSSTLCPRRDRPCGRAAEKCHELSPSHSITSSARPRSVIGIVRPSPLAALRLMISSTFVACWTGRSPGFSPLRIRPA